MPYPRVDCGECGAPMHLATVPATGALPARTAWRCTALGCPGIHGAHPDGRPMGIPADRRTRVARVAAHRAFDRLWKGGYLPSRPAAYGWLRVVLRIAGEAHIAELDAAACAFVEKAALAFIDGWTPTSSPVVDLDPWDLAPPGVDPDGPIDFAALQRATAAAHDVDPDAPFYTVPEDAPPSGVAPLVPSAAPAGGSVVEDPFFESPEGW